MSRRKIRTRRDKNEPEIIKAAESIGAKVWKLDHPVDLLVAYRGWNILVEVKTPKGGWSTDGQREWWEVSPWPGQRTIVRTEMEMVSLLVSLPDIRGIDSVNMEKAILSARQNAQNQP